MRLMYLKPRLKDLTIGSRIAFVRQFRNLTQEDVSEKLGLNGENKGSTMTRYEKGERIPKEDRILELSKIFNVNINSIKVYEYKEQIDFIYHLLWLEELYPDMKIELPITYYNENSFIIKKFMDEWNEMRKKRAKREITYEEYIECKLNYEI